MKFVILSPRQDGGGAIALHCLCRKLLDIGIDAKIFYFYGENFQKNNNLIVESFYIILFYIKDFIKYIIYIISKSKVIGGKTYYKDYFYEPIKGCKRKWTPFISEDTIVVYPDVIYGNILKAKNIVRWLLYFNRFRNDVNAYCKDDLFFCYREIFNDYQLNPECRMLYFQNFDFDLYKQINYGERFGCCYVVRKGKNRNDLPENFNGPVIDNWSEEDKVKAMNKYKVCYFYDTQTFYTAIAAVCGCIPIIVMEPGKIKEDYLGSGEYPLGVAYGDTINEIEYAEKTRDDCVNYLKQFDNNSIEMAENFVRICKEYFHEKGKCKLNVGEHE